MFVYHAPLSAVCGPGKITILYLLTIAWLVGVPDSYNYMNNYSTVLIWHEINVRMQRGQGVLIPLKNHKATKPTLNVGSMSTTKSHLNGASLAGRWCPAFRSYLDPHSQHQLINYNKFVKVEMDLLWQNFFDLRMKYHTWRLCIHNRAGVGGGTH